MPFSLYRHFVIDGLAGEGNYSSLLHVCRGGRHNTAVDDHEVLP